MFQLQQSNQSVEQSESMIGPIQNLNGKKLVKV